MVTVVGMDVKWLGGVADPKGRIRAGVVYEGDGITFTVWYQLAETGVEFRRVEVESDTHITATKYRTVRLGEMLDQVRQKLLDDPRVGSLGALLHSDPSLVVESEKERRFLEEQEERVKKSVEFLHTDQPQRDGKPLNDETMAFHSELYLSCFMEVGKKVNVAMLNGYRKEGLHVSMATLRWRTRKCIERDWLVREFFNPESGRVERAVQGQPGARAGPRLLEWRKEHEMEEE